MATPSSTVNNSRHSETAPKIHDLFWATLGEGGLVFALAAISWAARQPLIFASIGPTIYEMIELPHMRSARTYNIIVGHLIGLAFGFVSIYILNAWNVPNVISSGIVSPQRLWAMTMAASLTTFVTLLSNAGQPAALATTLLVASGAMQTRRDAVAIVAGVLIIAAMGEPIRLLRLNRIRTQPLPGNPP
jgi:hypothetical protein